MPWITASGAAAGPIGQGTWYLGEDTAAFARERSALQAGIEAGMTLIDTAPPKTAKMGRFWHLTDGRIRGIL